ncbi:MAG: TonB-dependent receptor [Cyclobacteriaceae bacterium]|nr:TonB-dependent receptor [Cyclobacteriaceae bacterium]
MRYQFFVFISAILSFSVFAQEKATLSGYVKDASNGEALIGATVYIRSLNTGTTTNVYGFYSLTLSRGNYEVEISYVGYSPQKQSVDLQGNVRLDIELNPQSNELQEVVITGTTERSMVETVEMSVNKIDIATISKIPAFLGEVDVIKSLQQLPGVATVGEGASGFNVRGGNVGQNLILLDEATVYNSSHLLGFFSVFNPDAVKDVKLYKGAVPAQYGGRISSLLDVRMKEGNNKDYEWNGGVGTIFSRLAFEGPMLKNKGSFIVAGRRSYIDILARPFVDVLQDGARLNFYDFTGKVNYNINDRNRIYLSGYTGRDIFFFDKNQGFSWGNNTATLRWNSILNDRLFLNVSGIYSKYDYQLQFGEDDQDFFRWNSSISNYTIKPNFSYFISSNNELSFGAEGIYYTFEPANASGASAGDVVDISLDRKYNLETAVYISNNQKVSKNLSLEYGIRYSNFWSYGPGNQYIYNDTTAGVRRTPISVIPYEKGEAMSQYGTWEPRFSMMYQINENSSVKASYIRMAQYLHLISNTTASNPLDVWTPTSNNIKPEIGDQYAAGYFRTLGSEKQFEFSIEAYYRNAKNQIDYIDGADLLINEFLEGDLLSGKGRAYGLEFYFQKKTGRLNGWIAYTLARTELQVEGINRGEWYPARFDQTHNLKLTGFYELSKRWSLTGNFTLLSGTPTTFPTSRYIMQGILIPYNANDTRNNVRIPAFHRLDISARLEGKTVKKNGKVRKNTDYWVFGLYNVYGRKNPFSIYFAQSDERIPPAGKSIESQAKQLSIIGTVVPAISYNFNF